MRMAIVFLFVAALAVGSFATSVGVTTTKLAAEGGILTNAYFESAAASSGTTPTVNTALAQPSGTGSTAITRGSTVRLWSTAFGSSKPISAGQWVLDLWAQASTGSGSLSVSVYITNSAGTVQTTIATGASMPSAGTTKAQVALTETGAASTVPAGGYIEVAVEAPSGGSNPASFTLYWGKAQGSNFQVPITVVTA